MPEDSRSSSQAWLTVLAAFLIVSLLIGAYFYFNDKPPVSAGQVLGLNIYPIHREVGGGHTTEGLAGQSETYDELLVFANVRITNQTNIPIFLQDMWAILNLPDGPQRNGAASQSDFDKVFVAYPATREFQKNPIQRDQTIQPGQVVEGMMIFHFEIPKEQWDSRTNMEIHVTFLHQNSLVITIPKNA